MKSLIQVASRGYKSLKITNVGKMVGFDRQDKFVTHTNVDVYVKGGKIAKIGKDVEEPEDFKPVKTLDVEGALITPGFIDPHTHIFPPKDRAEEFGMRVNSSYEEIAKAGGGILSSVKACRGATFDQLMEVNELNVKRFIANGTTTLEMKSGYGLNLETEVLLLEVINALKVKYAKYIDIVPTFLGAHAFPPEFKQDKEAYVKEICEKMIPHVAEHKLAQFCDVFCEEDYFNYEMSKEILTAAKKHGLKLRLHADEFKDSKGAMLGKQLRAKSVDHLMAISDKGIQYLSKGNVVATMLPGTTVFLGKDKFAPVRFMADNNIRVAIATDYNPGSCMFNSQPLMMSFAMQYGKLTVEEALKGVTRNAALSLNKKNVGIIDELAQADLLIWKLDNINQIPYYNQDSTQFLTHIIKKGRVFPQQKPKKIVKKAAVEPKKEESSQTSSNNELKKSLK